MKKSASVLGRGLVWVCALALVPACVTVKSSESSSTSSETSGGGTGIEDTGQDGATVGGDVVWGGGGHVLVDLHLNGDAPAGYYHDEVAAYSGTFVGSAPGASDPPGLEYLVFSKSLPAGTLNEPASGTTTKIDTSAKGDCFLFVDVQLKTAGGDVAHMYYRWMKEREKINNTGFTVKLYAVNKITPTPVSTPAKTYTP